MVSRNVIRFLALFFVALSLGPALAHLLEMPNKMRLSRTDYLIVQQIYDGWALLGIVVFGALASTLALTIRSRGKPEFKPALIAFLCIVGAQILFWAFTFPANQRTNNWRMLPVEWTSVRARWEFSHAGGAVLTLIAMISLIVASLRWETQGQDR